MSTPTTRWNSAPAAPPGLERVLHAAGRRIRQVMLARYCARALSVSALACLILLGASKLRLFETPAPWTSAVAIGLAVLGAAGLALLRPLSPLWIARATEQRAELKERLSSAVELHTQASSSGAPFRQALLVDAAEHAGPVDLKAIYPLRMPRELPVGLAAALALFLLFFLPTLPAFWSREKRQEVEEVRKQGQEIVRLAKETQKSADPLKLDATKKATDETRRLGEAMHRGNLDKKQSLVALQKLTKKMEETQRRMAASLPQKSLEQAHQEFKRSLDRMQQEAEKTREAQAREQRPRAGGAAQKSPASETPASKRAGEAMQRLAQAMAQQDSPQMQQALQQLGEQLQSGQMTPQERAQMQQALQRMAQSLQNTAQQETAGQMLQLAQLLQNQNSMDPKTLQQIASMCQAMSRTMAKCNGSLLAQLDAKTLAELLQALKAGRMTLCMGSKPGMGFGGNGPGRGAGGKGRPTEAMKDPGQTDPRLMAAAANGGSKGVGKSGSLQEFNRYLGQSSQSPSVLPNGKVAGMRTQKGNELQLPFTGDPDSAHSNSPYYRVYTSSRRQAESTLNKESIPAAYKEQVRDYFDNIRP